MFYFRTVAHYMRWGEEGEILREDFKRLVKSHRALEKVWNNLAKKAEDEGNALDAKAVDAELRMQEFMQSLRARGSPQLEQPESAVVLRYKAYVAYGKCAYAHKKVAFHRTLRGKAEVAQREAEAAFGQLVDAFSQHAQELLAREYQGRESDGTLLFSLERQALTG